MTKVSKNGLSTVTWYQNEKCSILIRDVKIIFSDIRFLKPKIRFFLLSFISRLEKLVQTGVKYE